MSVSTDKNFKSKLSKLKAWLIEIYGDCEIIPHADSIASGFSNETFVFDVSGKNVTESLVLRLRPTGYQVFPDYNLKRDFFIRWKHSQDSKTNPNLQVSANVDGVKHTLTGKL